MAVVKIWCSGAKKQDARNVAIRLLAVWRFPRSPVFGVHVYVYRYRISAIIRLKVV
jgi:hypothetical protein